MAINWSFAGHETPSSARHHSSLSHAFSPIDIYGVCVKNRSAAARLRSLRAITHDIEWDSIRVYLHFLQANIWWRGEGSNQAKIQFPIAARLVIEWDSITSPFDRFKTFFSNGKNASNKVSSELLGARERESQVVWNMGSRYKSIDPLTTREIENSRNCVNIIIFFPRDEIISSRSSHGCSPLISAVDREDIRYSKEMLYERIKLIYQIDILNHQIEHSQTSHCWATARKAMTRSHRSHVTACITFNLNFARNQEQFYTH